MGEGQHYLHALIAMLNNIITLAGVVTYFAGYNEQISGFSPPNVELFTSAGHCFRLALGK